ncbi:hypothetical protein CsSME_00000935 [Camellia sinensis var. sinensis]
MTIGNFDLGDLGKKLRYGVGSEHVRLFTYLPMPIKWRGNIPTEVFQVEEVLGPFTMVEGQGPTTRKFILLLFWPNAEIGSHYVVEAGFYMTSFAATLFLAALVTCGVLLVTLLIALTVMLQSCESRNAGIVEISKANENYNYCKIFSLHAELNSLDVDQFPEICRITAVQYIKEGQYAKDLNLTMGVAENYFNGVRPLEDGLDMVLMDIDDFLPLTSHCTDPLQSR